MQQSNRSEKLVPLQTSPGPAFTIKSDWYVYNYINQFNTNNVVYDSLFRFGTKYQKTSGTPMDKDPTYPTYIRTHGDRGWNQIGGWFDLDNNKDCSDCFVPISHDKKSLISMSSSSFSSSCFISISESVLMFESEKSSFSISSI